MHEADLAAAQVVEEAFLSPRVVDAATLSEFAESLREVLGGAAAQRERLRSAVEAGESVARALTESVAKAGKQLRPTLNLIPAIDQKLAQAEDALSRATQAARSAERAAGESAGALAEQGEIALHHAREAFGASLERARELEGRFGQAAQRAESAVEALDRECRQRLDGAAGHAEDVLGSMVAELDARAAQAVQRLTRLIEDRRAEAEAAVGGSIETGATRAGKKAGEERADEGGALATATEAASEACAGLEAMIESIQSRATGVADKLERRVSNATRRAKAAAERAGEAERLAKSAEERLAAAKEQLRLIDERGREIVDVASHALATFDEELAARMDELRTMMGRLAGETGGAGAREPAPAGATEAPDAPDRTTEVKPAGGPTGFVRIDRPIEADAPRGLPSRPWR